jgi:hypothetical protein
MAYIVFFFWQNDRSPQEGRNLLESAIKSAINRLGAKVEIIESLREGLELDKDTKGVPGNPPIFDTNPQEDRPAGYLRAGPHCRCESREWRNDPESECPHRIWLGAQVTRVPPNRTDHEYRSW